MSSILTGGVADKVGNRYEDHWLTLQFLRLISGEINTLRIEDPEEQKSECKITSNSGYEYHQCKRAGPAGAWTLSRLSQENVGVLQAMLRITNNDDSRFVFVSGSDCPELRPLLDIRRYCETFDEFKKQVEIATHQKAIELLGRIWESTSLEEIYRILNLIEVRAMDSVGLNEAISHKIQFLLLDQPKDVRPKISEFLSEKIAQTISAQDAEQFLSSNEFVKRISRDQPTARAAIEQITSKLSEALEERLIGRTLLTRKPISELSEEIATSSESIYAAILGHAGGGKSAGCLQLIRGLQAYDLPVLAFRLDRLAPVNTSAQLGGELGLNESPVHTLISSPSPNGAGVLIVDQLDFVSSSSGRHIDYLEAIEDLVREARYCSGFKIHVVLVCRQFDWENDHRFGRLLNDGEQSLTLPDLSPNELDLALTNAGCRPESLSPGQRVLLQRPQNLSLFTSLPDALREQPFSSSHQLFSRYWDTKRLAVSELCQNQEDRWIEVIDHLLQTLRESQELSVTQSVLDDFSPCYVQGMISEGILTRSGNRYGFGHESFFDYCFARRFLSKQVSLVDYLLGGNQHLFQRSQIRQALNFYRAEDFIRYVQNLKSLLENDEVRTHLKILTATTLATVENPSDEEWEVISPFVDFYLRSVESEEGDQPTIQSRIAEAILWSTNWAPFLLSSDVINNWLVSDSVPLQRLVYRFLAWHVTEHPSLVTKWICDQMAREAPIDFHLLSEIFQRVRWSPRHQDLFYLLIQLVDSGQLDESMGGVDGKSNFWSMGHGLEGPCCVWFVELLCSWLRRRKLIIQNNPTVGDYAHLFNSGGEPSAEPQWSKMIPSDDGGQSCLSRAIFDAPDAIFNRLIPTILSIVEDVVSTYGDPEDTKLPLRDTLIGSLFPSRYPTMTQVVELGISQTIENSCPLSKEKLVDIVDQLEQSETYFANRVLLGIYTSNPETFGDRAVALLVRQPWRLRCGFSDSSYWLAYRLIKRLSPVLADAEHQALETLSLQYRSAYETSKSGYRCFGRANWTFMSGFEPQRLSTHGKGKKRELDRKFGVEPPAAPQGIRGGEVQSPIEEEVMGKLSDQQWIRAIQRYDSDRDRSGRNFLKGGAMQLSRCLETLAAKFPARFANLALEIPDDSHQYYFGALLQSVCPAEIDEDLKISVIERVYALHPIKLASQVADAIGALQPPLTASISFILTEIATAHPDPDVESWKTDGDSHMDDILTRAINCTRGRAMIATGKLIREDKQRLANFDEILEAARTEESATVRCAAIEIAGAITSFDPEEAIRFFKDLVSEDLAVAASRYGMNFLFWAVAKNFDEVKKIIANLLESEQSEFQKSGAKLLALGSLYDHDISEFGNVISEGSESHRLGFAKIASDNFLNGDCSEKCQNWLINSFDDDSAQVRKAASRCFFDIKKMPIDGLGGLFEAYAASRSASEDRWAFLRALETSRSRIPDLTLSICEAFLDNLKSGDSGNGFNSASASLAALVFKLYQQNAESDIGLRALKIIDGLCLHCRYEANSKLSDYER